MAVRLRFAPSPTGLLHVGNVRTALVNFLYARKSGGEFWLRIDDTDKERSRETYVDALREDLNWLGIQWEEERRQSARFDLYEIAKQTLLDAGRLYPCYETADELDVKRKMLISRGKPPIYDRSALELTEAEQQKLEAEGRTPHYRFKLNAAPIEWDDLIRGSQRFHGEHLSDPVLIRADGVPLYMMPSAVDDGEMGITHVVRGEDHVSNTAVQLQLYEALGYTPPAFAHMSLLKTKDGELSKRKGGGDIRSLREAGILPMAVVGLLGKLGTSDPVEPFADMQPLIDGFDWGKFGRAPATYDHQELEKLNEKILHQLPFNAVKDQLPELDEDFWLAVRSNISRISDASEWWNLVHSPINSIISEPEYTDQAAALLPEEPWNGETWNQWINAIKSATGRKGKALFMPLRLALTGREDGPELASLLLLLRRERTLKRLTAA